MLRLKIKLKAKKESKNYIDNNNIEWARTPFIKLQLEKCKIIQEKIVSKERQINKILTKVGNIQAECEKFSSDHKNKIKTTDEEIARIEETIKQREAQYAIRNRQISDFNQNNLHGSSGTNENIMQIREAREYLAKEIARLNTEKEELYKKKVEIDEEYRNNLNEKCRELNREYVNLSNRMRKISSKVKQKISKEKNQAVVYVEYFWDYYINSYRKRKRKNKLKEPIPERPRLDTDIFNFSELFVYEKKKIKEFNDKYNINYNI